jgi:hypothetical protein
MPTVLREYRGLGTVRYASLFVGEISLQRAISYEPMDLSFTIADLRFDFTPFTIGRTCVFWRVSGGFSGGREMQVFVRAGDRKSSIP